MKKVFALTILWASLLPVYAGSMDVEGIQQQNADTSITNAAAEDSIIAEVLKTKAPPQKEKVQYFSQVTRYGFKKPVRSI